MEVILFKGRCILRFRLSPWLVVHRRPIRPTYERIRMLCGRRGQSLHLALDEDWTAKGLGQLIAIQWC